MQLDCPSVGLVAFFTFVQSPSWKPVWSTPCNTTGFRILLMDALAATGQRQRLSDLIRPRRVNSCLKSSSLRLKSFSYGGRATWPPPPPSEGPALARVHPPSARRDLSAADAAMFPCRHSWETHAGFFASVSTVFKCFARTSGSSNVK